MSKLTLLEAVVVAAPPFTIPLLYFLVSSDKYAWALSEVGISFISPFLQPKKIFEAYERFLSKRDKNLSQGSKISIVR
jgi:hypothetical protein